MQIGSLLVLENLHSSYWIENYFWYDNEFSDKKLLTLKTVIYSTETCAVHILTNNPAGERFRFPHTATCPRVLSDSLLIRKK